MGALPRRMLCVRRDKGVFTYRNNFYCYVDIQIGIRVVLARYTDNNDSVLFFFFCRDFAAAVLP
jgi:hypothetical protein